VLYNALCGSFVDTPTTLDGKLRVKNVMIWAERISIPRIAPSQGRNQKQSDFIGSKTFESAAICQFEPAGFAILDNFVCGNDGLTAQLRKHICDPAPVNKLERASKGCQISV